MRCAVFLAILAMLLAAPAGWAQTPSGTNSEQIRQVLSDAKNLVSLLKSDVATLDLLVGRSESSQSVMFNLFRGRTATLRSQADKLTALRKEGTHWQQIAIDRTVPAMQELAASAEAAIKWTQTAQNRANASYQEYFKLNSDLADELSKLITSCVDYAKTREDLERAAEKIEAPSASRAISLRTPDAEQEHADALRARVFAASATLRGAAR